MKVIFHIDERNKWNILISNVKNMLSYYGSNKQQVDIIVLVNAEAVIDCKSDSKIIAALVNLLAHAVTICVCQNSLDSRSIVKDDLIAGINVVASGVVELALKQQEGYAYIKP